MPVTILRTEKRIKRALETYLKYQGWNSNIAWGTTHGIDIEAKQGQNRWIIEVGGWQYLEDDPANSFVSLLGKVLQRMDDADARYSIALPDLEPFRRLWDRLPGLAKSRVRITALFVNPEGTVTERS